MNVTEVSEEEVVLVTVTTPVSLLVRTTRGVARFRLVPVNVIEPLVMVLADMPVKVGLDAAGI
jgi:hypothetical protein